MDHSSPAKFEYRPLLPISATGNPGFRILDLQPRSFPPGPDDGPVAGRLIDASLGECEPYETLSYCWGDASVKVPISLDGMRFEVTTNLYAALRRLRKYTQTRRIWIDAICVNQDDTDERNEQIQHMRRIYSETIDCFVWLGEFKDSTVKLALEGYTWLREIREQNISHPEYKDLSIHEYLEVMSSTTLVSPAALGALKAIVDSPWFRRVWVIQEITFPKTVSLILGYAVLDWDFTATLLTYNVYLRPWSGPLALAISMADSSIHIDVHRIHDINSLRVERSYPSDTWKVWWKSLLQFRGFDATDPRDNIFALMGLVEYPDDGILPLPDYHLSTVETSIQLTRKILLTSESLDPLIYGGCGSGGRGSIEMQRNPIGTNLPSWVINWEAKPFTDPIFTSLDKFQATSNSLLAMEWTEQSPSKIRFQGYCIDQVNTIVDLYATPDPDSIHLPEWRATMAASPAMMAYSKEQLDCLFARTVTAGNCGPENVDSEGLAYPVEVVLEYLEMIGMTDDQKDRYFETCDSELLKTKLTDVSERVKTICPRRIVTATEKGRMGLVPDHTEVEDCVFLLEGGDVPFVLRPRLDGSWMLVGHCYLDGVMYGGAYEKEKCRDVIVV